MEEQTPAGKNLNLERQCYRQTVLPELIRYNAVPSMTVFEVGPFGGD